MPHPNLWRTAFAAVCFLAAVALFGAVRPLSEAAAIVDALINGTYEARPAARAYAPKAGVFIEPDVLDLFALPDDAPPHARL